MPPEIVRADSPPSHAWKRLAWFLGVGCGAALVHFCVVWVLVQRAGMAPLAANVLGWVTALGFSFGGHYGLTFRHSNAPFARAAARFALLSATGFAVNECAYALLLRTGWLRFDVALALVLVGIAALTYLASARWAFRSGSGPT